GEIARALRVQELIAALVVPAVPCVQLGSRVALDLRALRALHDRLLVRPHVERFAASRDDARAAAAAAAEGGGLVVDPDPVVACLLDGDSEVRCVELDRMPGLEAPEIQRHVTRGDLE